MTGEETGEALGHLLFDIFTFVVVVATIVGVIYAIVHSRRAPSPQQASIRYWAGVFGLVPGEGCGTVWQAAHPLGHPMVATITSMGVFSLNHSSPHSPPLRLRPEGVSVASSPALNITTAADEPMVEVTLTVPGGNPIVFALSQSGADALAAWAVPTQ